MKFAVSVLPRDWQVSETWALRPEPTVTTRGRFGAEQHRGR